MIGQAGRGAREDEKELETFQWSLSRGNGYKDEIIESSSPKLSLKSVKKKKNPIYS